MKVAFCQTSMREQFGFMYLSAMLKQAGHEVEVFIFKDYEKNPFFATEDFLKFKADLYGFSSSTLSFKNDLEIAEAIKIGNPNAFIMFGGAHPTFNPDEVIKNSCIDAICIGEGYDAIVELANDIKKKDIKSLWIRDKNDYEEIEIDELLLQTNKIFNSYITKKEYKIYKNPLHPKKNINDLPMPDYDLYYKKYPELANKTTKQVYIVSGCPYECQFCYNPSYNELYKGQSICQQMNVDKAINEIKWLKDNYGFKWLQFISDNMSVNKKWLKEFLYKYSGIKNTPMGIVKGGIISSHNFILSGIAGEDLKKSDIVYLGEDGKYYKCHKDYINKPYLLNIRANEIDEETIKLLKDTGCDRVDFGIEHGNDYIRNNILKRNMSKEQIINCGNLLNKYGIRFQTTNIFGLPHEDLDKAIESITLNRIFKPEISKACILQPFKNTGVYNYAKERGLLKDDLEYSGTTLQIGVNDNRSEETKIKIKNEKQIVRLSYLFDFFVKQSWIPVWLIKVICYLPGYKLYHKYYPWIFKKQEERYK